MCDIHFNAVYIYELCVWLCGATLMWKAVGGDILVPSSLWLLVFQFLATSHNVPFLFMFNNSNICIPINPSLHLDT